MRRQPTEKLAGTSGRPVVRQVLSAVVAGSCSVGLLAAPAMAAPGPASSTTAPTITFATPQVNGLGVTISYDLNRAPKQIAGLACSLTGSAGHGVAASCGAVTSSTTKTTTRQVTLSSLHPDAYTYSVAATMTDGNKVTRTATFTIAKLQATCAVTGYSVAYNAVAHTATGTCTGLGGVDLSAGLDLSGTTHTSAGTYTDSWSFTDPAGNYADSHGSVSDSVAQIAARCTIGAGIGSESTGAGAGKVSFGWTYDGVAHTVPGSCTGLGGADLSADLDLSATTRTDAGTYIASWFFVDPNGNYASQTGTVTEVITQAAATCTLPGLNIGSESTGAGAGKVSFDPVYDGTAHTVPGTCTGIGGLDLSADLDLSAATHTDAGTYVDNWSFVDPAGNYASQNGTTSWSIRRANASCVVTGYDVGYDATAHTATGTCTGVGGVDLSAGLDLSGTTHTDSGSYSDDSWSFTDSSGNYADATGQVTDTIH
jgi:hypothetical protein